MVLELGIIRCPLCFKKSDLDLFFVEQLLRQYTSWVKGPTDLQVGEISGNLTWCSIDSKMCFFPRLSSLKWRYFLESRRHRVIPW